LISGIENILGIVKKVPGLSQIAAVAQFVPTALLVYERYEEAEENGTEFVLTDEEFIDLSTATIGVIAIVGVGTAVSAAIAFVGIGGGVYSLFRDDLSWDESTAIWDKTTDIYDSIVEAFADAFNDDLDEIFLEKETLAVAQLISNIDSSLGVDDIEIIFNATDNGDGSSAELILNNISEILNIGETVAIGDSDALFNQVSLLNETLFTDLLSDPPTFAAEYEDLQIEYVANLATHASQNTAEGYAYRYALINLTSIAIVGTADLYAVHNTNGELSADNFSTQYLNDRAEMLSIIDERNFDDVADGDSVSSTDSKFYWDFETDTKVATDDASIALLGAGYSQIKFGTDSAESFGGDTQDDLLYGGGGSDSISGFAGNDYIEGNTGADYLYGDEGDDFLDGGDGEDTLKGGADNDNHQL